MASYASLLAWWLSVDQSKNNTVSSSTCCFWYSYIWYHWEGASQGLFPHEATGGTFVWVLWEASSHQVEAAGSETATFNLWIKLNIDSNSPVLGDLWRDVTDLQPRLLTEFRKENKLCYVTLDDSTRQITSDLNRLSSITVPERRLADRTRGSWGRGAVSPALWDNNTIMMVAVD